MPQVCVCAALWQSLSFSAVVANLSDFADHWLATIGWGHELIFEMLLHDTQHNLDDIGLDNEVY